MRRRLSTIGLATLVVSPMVAIATVAPAVLLRLDNERLNDESRAIAFGDLIAGDRIWVERRVNSSSAWEQSDALPAPMTVMGR